MKKTVILFKGKSYKESLSRAQQRVSLIPLSLIAIAAPLRAAGYTVEIIDQQDPVDDIYSRLLPLFGETLCIGISALTGNEIKEGVFFSTMIKKSHPEIPVVWGGWHVSVLPEESIKYQGIDIIVKGLGQVTFLNLVNAIARQERDFSSVPGVYFKRDGAVVKTMQDQDIKLESVPLPAFDMLDLEYYRQQSLHLRHKPVIDGLDITGYLYYVSSFGCPCACAYCCNDTIFRRRSYAYPAEKVVDQIGYLVEEKGFNSIGFMDANFFININRVENICRLILQKNIRFAWDAQMHVTDIIRYEKKGILKLIRESGCFRVNVGSESGSQEVLDYINKRITIEEIRESARILKRYDMEAAYNLLFGLPMIEKRKHLYESFRLAEGLKKISPDFSLPVSFYVPFPGTPMYRDAVQGGLRVPDTLAGWGDFDTKYDGDSQQNYPWRSRSDEELIRNVMFFYIPLALPGNMCRGTLTLIKEKLKSSRLRWFIKVGHRLAKWRLRYSFFRFPFEIYIFKLYRSMTRSSEYVPGGKC